MGFGYSKKLFGGAGGGGGVTNSATANKVTKSDGTNLVATALNEASAGAITTDAGTALGLTATAPAATTGASQVGKAVTITASPAVASTDTNGAAAGGSVTITAGAAARRVSGDANGGDINLTPGAGIGTGTNGQVVGPAGSETIPSFTFSNSRGSGIYATDANGMSFSAATGGRAFLIYNSDVLGTRSFGMPSTGTLFFTNGLSNNGAPDIILRRKAAANPAWGVAAASPVAYTHTLAADARGAIDTDVAGAAATLQAGTGTGTGGGGALLMQTAVETTTGTTQNTYQTREYFAPKAKTLTESSATTVFNVAVESGGYVGGSFTYTVYAADANERQAHTGTVNFSAVNKAGTVTGAINEPASSEATAVSSGTVTDAWTAVANGNSVDIKCNAVSSLTQTTLNIRYVILALNGSGALTVTP